MTIQVGIFGATGYTGLELARLLDPHPAASIAFATSESMAGQTLRASHPQAPAVTLVRAADAPLDAVDVAFLCLPHTEAALTAARAVDAGAKVIDLSADLRLHTPGLYEQWYKTTHPAPELLPAPYGLPELWRDEIVGARAVANPGCYATAMLLALTPLVRAGVLVEGAPLIVDAKSGVSGAGRTPKTHTVFGEVHGNFSPYGIGRAHRHLAEVEQMLAVEGLQEGGLVFAPHLLPTDRGILAAAYVQVTEAGAARAAIEAAYATEPLVDMLPAGALATLAHVVRTPKAALSVTPVGESMVIVNSAIDNLLKGAASQAVQNFNLVMGLPETAGLLPAEKALA